jgi:N-methylhydantoinase A
LARALGLARVVVPPNPGAFSALGILISDIVKDASRSVLRPIPRGGGKDSRQFAEFLRQIEADLGGLEKEARAELGRENFAAGGAKAEWRLDVRYVGQAYELTVPFAANFPARFHRAHAKAYGYAHSGRPLEVVNLRVRLAISTAKPPPRRITGRARRKLSEAVVKVKPVWFSPRFWEAPLYARERLAAGMRFQGPAVIVEYSSTTVVPPGCNVEIDQHLNLVLFND